MEKQKVINRLYLFVGTNAELIKLAPIIRELDERNISYKTILSGQNIIDNSELYSAKYISKKIDVRLSNDEINQTPWGLFTWFLKTTLKGIFIIKKEFSGISKPIILVHGDTVSTLMGAILSKMTGAKIIHVETGLRSFNIFSPFPEELCRILVSKMADYHFCPNAWSLNNLKNVKGKKYNTQENTLYDSYRYAIKHKTKTRLIQSLIKNKYSIAILHRQENLLNINFVNKIISCLNDRSKLMKCVFIVHPNTLMVLKENHLFSKIKSNKNIVIIERLGYFEFQNLLSKCEYILTDGGSNQEECYYYGIPCLIMRNNTERIEGLGKNILLSTNIDKIVEFTINFQKYRINSLEIKISPSKYIVDQIYKLI